MNNVYITYFDFLGFKSFISNNTIEHIRKRIGHILRDLESSLGQGEFKETNYGIISDISNSRLNCLNISDTIILWTKDDSYDSFNELVKVSFDFNWRLNRYHFPVRGYLVYDSIEAFSHYQENEAGGTYNVNSIFGKGLVNAHVKAEELNMAGCIIDKSVIENTVGDTKAIQLIDKYAEKYETSFKTKTSVEYVFRFWINKKLNEETVKNTKEAIRRAFEDDNKGMNARSEELYENTAKFVESFLE